jgi:hypothetical protein
LLPWVIEGSVGAHHEVAALGYRGVGHPLDVGDADGRRRPGHQPGVPYLFIRRQAQVVAVQAVLQFDLVNLQVAPHGDKDRFSVGGVEDGLQRLGAGHIQELGQLGNGFDAGGSYVFQGQLRLR